ncbi:MAG: hypothetical protein ABIG63_07045 [Chloroflexota bacterium]
MKNNWIEVEEDGTPYDEVCVHGVHFGGYNCWVCHPEKLSPALQSWLFPDEIPPAPVVEQATLPLDKGCFDEIELEAEAAAQLQEDIEEHKAEQLRGLGDAGLPLDKLVAGSA